MGRTAEIRVKVALDEKNVPESIQWEASDGPAGSRYSDAMMFSVWDPEKRNTLSIDLWTSKMTVDEMNFFVLQALMKLADTYRKATNQPATAGLLDGFVGQLTEHLEQQAKERAEAEPEEEKS